MTTAELQTAISVGLYATSCGLFAHGLRLAFAVRSLPRDVVGGADTAVLLTRGLRAGLMGLCLAVGTWAWQTDNSTVLTIAIVIGAEELYETSMALVLLRRMAARERVDEPQKSCCRSSAKLKTPPLTV